MQKIDTRTFLDFEYPSNPSFSPDGGTLAYVVSRISEEENKYFGDIWQYDIASGATRRMTSSGDARSYIWMTDGKLLFGAMRDEKLKKRADSGEPLSAFYELDPHGGEATLAFTLPLSGTRLKPIDANRYLVSASYDNTLPDLTGLSDEEKAKVLQERKDAPCEVLTEFPFWSNGGGFNSGERTRLYIFDRASGDLRPITPEWFEVDSFALSHDGKTVVISGGEWHGFFDYFHKNGLLICDLDTLELRELLPDDSLTISSFDFLDANTLILVSGNGTTDSGSFHTLDISTGELRQIAKNDHSVGYGSVASDARVGGGRGSKVVGEKWYFTSTRGISTVLCGIDRAGNIETIPTPDGSCDCFDLDGDHLAYCGLFGDKLSELYLDGRQITNFSATLADYDVRMPEFHSFTASDGFEIHGWALTPSGYTPGTKYPAILHIHGGPRTAFGSIFHHEMQVWANAGYFVFYCNPRGSDGRGDAFADIFGRYGEVEYANIMEFADAMLAKYPDADPERFGVTGGSYGGFMTNWIIGHTNRFKCACSQRSISNWTSFEHTSDIGHLFTKMHHTALTRESYEKLWEHSPLKYAPNCATPTLFIHSDADYRCPLPEGLAMFSALKQHGCEAKLCIFKGENHDLSRSGKPKSRIRRMNEILDWFDKYLK